MDNSPLSPPRRRALLLLLFVLAASLRGQDAELGLIRSRLAARYAAAAPRAVPEDAASLAARIRPDGSWLDVDYSVRAYPGQVGFPAFPHLERLRKLAGAAALAAPGEGRRRLLDRVHHGIAYWLQARPETGQIWYLQIGAPLELGQTAIMLEPELTAEERRGIGAILRTARRPDGHLEYSFAPATGQNLIWEAEVQVLAGCIDHDPGEAAKYARLAEERAMTVVTEPSLTIAADGIQPDWSFHQHGPQLYSAGAYGLSFATDCAAWAAVLRGTSLAYSAASIDRLTHMVLDGQQWMARGRTWDFNALGRHIAWREETMVDLAPACDDLAALAPARAAEFAAFARRLRGREPAEGAPTGAHVFWSSDYVAQTERRWLASVRMSSTRTMGNESGNGEGVKNFHLGDGATAFLVTGEEYRDLFPLWDWEMVPGVTCRHTSRPLPINIWGRGALGGDDFAGGVTDGFASAAAMRLDRGGMRARKAWFFLPDCVVCLGTDLAVPAPDGTDVITGVDQCWALGEAELSTGAVPRDGKTSVLRGPGWVREGGRGYVFPAGGEVRVRTERRSGLWSAINTAMRSKPPAVAGRVFSLWLDQGADAAAKDYAYVVVPDAGRADLAEWARRRMPRILANGPVAQAVATADGTLLQMVFWQAGEVSLPGGARLTADRPGLAQLRRTAAGWIVAAGNPRQVAGRLQLRIEGDAPGLSAGTATFEFPAGIYSGRPQTRPWPDGTASRRN